MIAPVHVHCFSITFSETAQLRHLVCTSLPLWKASFLRKRGVFEDSSKIFCKVSIKTLKLNYYKNSVDSITHRRLKIFKKPMRFYLNTHNTYFYGERSRSRNKLCKTHNKYHQIRTLSASLIFNQPVRLFHTLIFIEIYIYEDHFLWKSRGI